MLAREPPLGAHCEAPETQNREASRRRGGKEAPRKARLVNTHSGFSGDNAQNRTRLGGGGRDWTVREDGTIAARHSPHLVLGTRPPPGVKGAGYEENFARICFPVAGHPDYDQGAYHEPCGLCCYTRRRHEHDYPDDEIVGNVLCFPLVLGLYAGTLCYQPCGCICAHQCPWLEHCTL